GRQRGSALARRGRAPHRRRGQRGGPRRRRRRALCAHGPGGSRPRLRPAHPRRRGGRPLLPPLDAMTYDILAVLVLLPVAGAIVHAFIPGHAARAHKVFALALTTAIFLLSLMLLDGFQPVAGMQFEVS